MNVEKMKQVKKVIAKSEAPPDETIDLVGILTGGRRPPGCQTDEWPQKLEKEANNTKSTKP